MSVHIIDRHCGETLYRQIYRLLEQEIRTCYSSVEFLPSEKELAERFSVNRHTLRRAIDELVASGLVERRHGIRTKVLEPSFNYSIGENSRFTELLEAQGEATDSQVIRKLVMPARNSISSRLGLKEGEAVIWIETLRKVNNLPFCLISHFIPQKPFHCIESDYNSGSLHQFIQYHLAITLSRTNSLITALLPQGDDALHLKIPQHIPLLRVKSLNVNIENNSPVEYAITRFRSDRIQLAVNF